MTTYVFLGPSLPVEQATRLLDATYLPPIQQGDLLRLLDRKPRYVGIIDGYFETVPAVWHKEILLAMSSGVHVFGAASMGALRAAELHSFGMVGFGEIFQWYRDGKIIADDEVAVRHAPAELGYLPLNQALVDIRDSCAAALREGVIGAQLAEQIVSCARALPYWERCYDAVETELRRSEATDLHEISRWLEYVKTRCVSLKARDAATLLTAMKKLAAEPWKPKQVNFEIERTIFVERLLNEIALEKANKTLSLEHLNSNSEEQSIDYLKRTMLLRVAARGAAKQFGWELSTDEISEKASTLFARIGLLDSDSALQWMKRNTISEQMFRSYVNDELYIDRLMRTYQLEVDREIFEQMLITHARQLCGTDPASSPAGEVEST
jgi:hypothetical protein